MREASGHERSSGCVDGRRAGKKTSPNLSLTIWPSRRQRGVRVSVSDGPETGGTEGIPGRLHRLRKGGRAADGPCGLMGAFAPRSVLGPMNWLPTSPLVGPDPHVISHASASTVCEYNVK
jgi:hypothetical protein